MTKRTAHRKRFTAQTGAAAVCLVTVSLCISVHESDASICNRYWQDTCGRQYGGVVHATKAANDDINERADDVKSSHAALRSHVTRRAHGCRHSIKQLTCQFIAHICQHDAVTSFPPCRETCQRVMDTCMPPVHDGVVSWMDFINCNALPARGSYSCISDVIAGKLYFKFIHTCTWTL